MNDGSTKSAGIVLSKSIIDVKNQQKLERKISLVKIDLGDCFLLKTFFSSINF